MAKKEKSPWSRHAVKSYVRVTKNNKLVPVKFHMAYNPNSKPKSNKI